MGHLHCNDLMIYAAGMKPDESPRRIGPIVISWWNLDYRSQRQRLERHSKIWSLSARLGSKAVQVCASKQTQGACDPPSHSIDRISMVSCCLHRVMWHRRIFRTQRASTVVTSSWISYEKPRSQNLPLPFVPSKNRLDRVQPSGIWSLVHASQSDRW